LRLEAAVGHHPERVAIREGLASGKALQAHLSAAARRAWSAAAVQPCVEPPILRGTGSIAITTLAVQICTFCASASL